MPTPWGFSHRSIVHFCMIHSTLSAGLWSTGCETKNFGQLQPEYVNMHRKQNFWVPGTQSQFPWADRGGCLDSSAWLWFSVAATSAPCHSTSTAGQPCLPHPEKQGPRPQLTPQQFPHTVPRRPLTTWMAQRTIWITSMTSRMEKRFRFQEITFSGSRHLLHKDLSLR